jgi:hypothetical protein
LAPARLDLDAIAHSLRTVQREFARINAQLRIRREPMSDEIVARMIAGYGLVATLVEQGIEPFAHGSASLWLELNALVLCGDDPARRQAFALHVAATEARFYAEPGGGIGAIAD